MEGLEVCEIVVAVVFGFGVLVPRAGEGFEGFFGDDVAGKGFDVGPVAEES